MMKFALVSALATLALSASASAQLATFCNNQISVDSMYDTIKSNGHTSQVDYFAQVRNTTNKPLQVMVRFQGMGANAPVQNAAPGVPATVRAYESTRVALGNQRFNNPAGQGKFHNDELKSRVAIACHP